MPHALYDLSAKNEGLAGLGNAITECRKTSPSIRHSEGFPPTKELLEPATVKGLDKHTLLQRHRSVYPFYYQPVPIIMSSPKNRNKKQIIFSYFLGI